MTTVFCLYYILSKLIFLLCYALIPKKGAFWNKLRLKLENRIFFSPRIKKIYPVIPELKNEIEAIKLITRDCVKIYGWYVNPNNESTVAVFCHGQSENISKWQNTVLFLKKAGIGSLFLSYRGHYRSAGLPSEQGIYTDAECAIEFLHKKGIKSENIIFWGRSLGSCVACEIALKYKLKAVILESAIYDIKTAAITISDMYLKRIKLQNLKPFVEKLFEQNRFIQNFENNKKIEKIECPILILHSKEDKKIPYNIAKELHKLNKNSTLFLSEEGSHNSNEWCLDRVKEFFKELNLVENINEAYQDQK